jgi:hypothetical protein
LRLVGSLRKMTILLLLDRFFHQRVAAHRSPRASNLLASASLFRRIFVKQVFGSCCAIAVLLLALGASTLVSAQSASATPDPFVSQITSSPAGDTFNPFASFAGDISANGRFVVFESNGDVATEKIPTRNPDGSVNPSARNNEDGNREIFLLDYAQRRIFQLTDTKNVLKASATPTPTPSPSASPTPTPSPTPADPAQTEIEISNNHPMISFEPTLVGGTRVYTIVFSSNAPNPASFGGTGSAALSADANQEIWIYQVPAVADVDLTTGDDFFLNLAGGTFTQITTTPASRPPTAGATGVLPFVADDNREATINDDGTLIAFISTRNLVGTGNTDGNPELFFRNVPGGTFVQATNTADTLDGVKIVSRFQQNPSLSSSGNRVAFISTANLTGANDDDGRGKGNAEVYVADFTGSGLTAIRQVTRTKSETTGAFVGSSVNLLGPGRRLSRDGALIGLESRAVDPKANDTATNTSAPAIFVYNVAADSFVQVGLRALSGTDIRHFPTFTDYTGTVPGTLVFSSALNFKTDGSFPAADQDATGLNPTRQPQIFITDLPVSSTSTFKRLTTNPSSSLASDVPIRPLASGKRNRMTFSLTSAELGGGNADLSVEVYYLLSPTVTTELSGTPLSFFAKASIFPVNDAPPAGSPSPSPTPTPTPGTIAFGLAPGEMGIVRSTVALAPADKVGAGGAEAKRSPILPVELNGVSVSINGAAAGLYFVGNASKEIHFVVPIGLSTGVATFVINNNGTVIRGSLNIVPAQPDIFTVPPGPGGRAVVCNITNAGSGCITEPFGVTTAEAGTGTQIATKLEIHLTGVRGAKASEVSVTIGTTAIAATTVINNVSLFGEDLITIILPASLAGAGDVPVIVTVTKSGTFMSRDAATAPKIRIN